jgi:NAD(P)-dependent dehydrogenase (short-subunit alcohol dehydrogenase family)
MTELNGTVAVVTGAGRGIGREIMLHQAQGGAKVAVLDRTARYRCPRRACPTLQRRRAGKAIVSIEC